MLDFETASITLTVIVMVILMFISLIPFIPGPALLWTVAVVFALANGFERVHVVAVVVMTILMLIGSTQDLWLRFLGMQRRGGSCWGVLGSFLGGLLGTVLIPVPILGTLIGAVAGALLIEFMRLGEIAQAMQSGRSVVESYFLGIAIEFAVSIGILTTFLVSVWLTA
ncbi:MAG: DUF456 family protein [Anaerolineales bacterium]